MNTEDPNGYCYCCQAPFAIGVRAYEVAYKKFLDVCSLCHVTGACTASFTEPEASDARTLRAIALVGNLVMAAFAASKGIKE